jgi:7-carboxy-7-deazaguanine synthase
MERVDAGVSCESVADQYDPRMGASVLINEIYLSLQGESTWAGLPCAFIRLSGCHLRCSYCDTAYAFRDGTRLEIGDVLARVRELAGGFSNRTAQQRLPLVEVTGGEPLLQEGAFPLMTALCDEGYSVLLETGGAADISRVDPRVHRIMDLKCPSSGECHRNRWQNLSHLGARDEVKFVVGTVEDYEWMKRTLAERDLVGRCPVLVSWVTPLEPRQQDPSLRSVPDGQTPISRRELVDRMVAESVPARFQLQMHKFIWPVEQRGV